MTKINLETAITELLDQIYAASPDDRDVAMRQLRGEVAPHLHLVPLTDEDEFSYHVPH